MAHWQLEARSTFRRLPAEQATASGIDWGKADGTKDHPVWAAASVPIVTEPSKYDDHLVVLRALNPRPSESGCTRASSYQASRGQNMMVRVACPGLPSLSWAATRRTQPRRVAIRLRSLSCRTCRLPCQWAAVGDDILQMIVCLRDGKEPAQGC